MVNITGGIKSHHKAVIYSNSQMPSMAIVLQSARDQSPLTAVVCPISMYTHGAFAVAGIDPPFQFVHMGVAASKSVLVSTPCHLKIPLFWVVFPFSPIAYLLIIRN